MRGRSSDAGTGVPSRVMITSPALRPARSAGPPASASATSAPFGHRGREPCRAQHRPAESRRRDDRAQRAGAHEWSENVFERIDRDGEADAASVGVDRGVDADDLARAG